MRKLLFIAMMAIAGVITANAQKTSGFELGGGLGVNFSVVSDFDGQNSTNTLTSFNFGATAEYYFSDRWGLKVKLISDQKGWADGFITGPSLNTVTTDFQLNYLTIPVMANWHFGSTRKWYLHFGAYVGVLIKAEDTELGIDVKDGLESTDFGLAFGIGYKFPIAENTNFFVEYDAQSGLSDIIADNTGDAITNARSSFNIGVLFSL